MIPLSYRAQDSSAAIDNALRQFACDLRVATPGIVQSFDAVAQTVSVQPAITEVILREAVPTAIPLPVLHDVPIVFPRAGGFSVTLPVAAGDECLLIFNDMCIDQWWQSGGVQGQPARFRHALGDAVAVFGVSSQPRKLANYSTGSLQLRSDDGLTAIDLAPGTVTVTAPHIDTVSPSITAAAQGGTPLPLVNRNFMAWFTLNVMPFLIAKGYTGPAPPASSVTTVFEAQ